MIKVVGLGRCEKDITLGAIEEISKAKFILVKTKETDTFRYFALNNIKCTTCDSLYNKAGNFVELNQLIVEKLLKYAEKYGEVTFCVNGSGSDDTTVALLKQMEIKYDVINGVGYQENVLQYFPSTNVNVLNAIDVSKYKINTSVDTVIKEIDDEAVASDVKLQLLSVYGDEMDVVVFNNQTLHNIKLFELDMEESYDINTTLYLPALKLRDKIRYGYNDLIEVLDILRGDNGCPWDKAQTHMSLRSNAIEEAYEVAEAVDKQDTEMLIEELGDLILQPLLQTKVAIDDNEFDYSDVFTGIVGKLISRHTHIFSVDKASTAKEALSVWETNKAKEKKTSTYTEEVNNVPTVLSSLMRAYKISKRAAKSGFDFVDVKEAFDKVKEEISEVEQVLNDTDANRKEDELGDVLLSIVNVCRLCGVEPEVALNRTINKYLFRFSYMESKVLSLGLTLEQCTMEQMNQYWNEAKGKENV